MIRTSWLRRGIAVALLPVAVVLGATTPAYADDADGQQCILLVDDGRAVCAPTLEEADAAFTAATGLVRVVEEGEGDDLRVVYSLATLHPNNGYGGAGYTFVRSTPCNGSTVSGVSDLSTIGMNDVVSSFQTYGSCQVRLYEHTGYAGSTFGYTTSSTSVGALNDLASSARVR